MSISAEKLNMLRIQNGWSQERLADISGLSLRTIQRLERGESASLESQLAISKAFDIPPSELLEDEVIEIGEGGVNWSGISGLLLSSTLVIMMFHFGGGVEVFLDLPSLILSIFLPLGMAAISLGVQKTMGVLCLLRFIFVLPNHHKGLQSHVSSLNWLIFYCYAAGIISALIGFVAVLFFPTDFTYQGLFSNRDPILVGVGIALLTLVYNGLLAEMVIRPLKHQIERLIIQHVYRDKSKE